jgi:hypothetical protein
MLDLKTILLDAIHRNILVYDSEDERGIFTLRLARLMIDHCIKNAISPEIFVIPSNNEGFTLFETIATPTEYSYPPGDDWKLYGKTVHFVPESEYQDLMNIHKNLDGRFPYNDNHLCMCGNKNTMLLGSF